MRISRNLSYIEMLSISFFDLFIENEKSWNRSTYRGNKCGKKNTEPMLWSGV